ncbi:ATP-grasp domain-containing protein [Hoyosella sp. YIM 151337]|uniref:ATP-grasp domain-containing protein n=1 Tax=Hoyosella sp. YIM 151337 TaxID=2992742 RepID=UPI0022362C47|nr:ATP-grasp domain-containing protein [Hoyosella sp. YIM 151337]MCW4355496.1 ATP-grasp domain-containing protein [Hoyosella sp. YIM 151337]
MSFTVLVPGMTEKQHRLLQQVEQTRDVQFRPLLDYERLVAVEEIDFGRLLDAAREEIAAFDGRIDAIIPHWDFPTSVLAPILAADLNLRAPTLESVLKCEHKYWSRAQQRDSVPACAPEFELIDPFDAEAAEKAQISYPFWLKPVKSHSSQMGFRVGDRDELRAALEAVKESISDIGDAFAVVLDQVRLPDSIHEASARKCIAEELLTGIEFAIEGWAVQGEIGVHGVIDMTIEADSHAIDSFIYPATRIPRDVQERAIAAAKKFLLHIEYMDGCFNAEFIWDEERDLLRVVEFNTRISQSHTEMFINVDGAPNHLVALDVAQGRVPEFPYRQGKFGVAAHCYLTTTAKGVVTKVPTSGEIYAVAETLPGTSVDLEVEQGQELSAIAHQDAYRSRLAKLNIAADGPEQLKRVYEACRSQLLFEIKRPDAEEKTDGDHHEFPVRDRIDGE